MFLTKKLIVHILLFFIFFLFIYYFISDFPYIPARQKRTQYDIIVPNKEVEKDLPDKEIETDAYTRKTETLAETVEIKTRVPEEETGHNFIFQEESLKQQENFNPYYDEYVAGELIANNQVIDSIENDFIIEEEIDIESEIKTIDIPSPSNDVFEKQIDNELEFKKVDAISVFDNNLGLYSEVVGGEFELKTISESGLSNIIKENENHYIEEKGVRLKVKEEKPIVEEEETSTISNTELIKIGIVVVGELAIIGVRNIYQKIKDKSLPRIEGLDKEMADSNKTDEQDYMKSALDDEQDYMKSAFDDDEEFDFDNKESEFNDDKKFIWDGIGSKKRFWSEGNNLGRSEKISIGSNDSSGLMFATAAPLNSDSTSRTIHAPSPNLTRRQILSVRGQQRLIQVNRNILRRLQLRIVRMPRILRFVRAIEDIRADIGGNAIDMISNITIARRAGNSLGLYTFIIDYNPFEETESPLPFTMIYFCFILYGFIELEEIFNYFFNYAQTIVNETNSLRCISFYGQDARKIVKIIENIFNLTQIMSVGEKKVYLSFLNGLITILNNYIPPVHKKGEH